MIVLDTNVVSEMMKPSPDGAVLAWLGSRPLSEQHTTAITLAEVRYGIARLPRGRRRYEMGDVADAVFGIFEDRILPVDSVAASLYGEIRAERESAGTPIHDMDALVASVCRAHGAVLVTRNVPDFTGLDLELINPWDVLTS